MCVCAGKERLSVTLDWSFRREVEQACLCCCGVFREKSSEQVCVGEGFSEKNQASECVSCGWREVEQGSESLSVIFGE